MTNIEIRTRSIYDSLSKGEQKVADYFLRNKQSVFDLPIADLAQGAGVSKVTWVRFCKSIGFEGLKDMKRTLISEMREGVPSASEVDGQNPIMFQDIKDFTTVAQMAQSVQLASVNAIENTIKLLDFAVVDRVAEAILSASTVKLFAVGASALVAEDLESKLMRIGKSVCFSRDLHVQLTCAANLKPDELAFFISYSGQTTEVLESMKLAKAHGSRCVVLSRFGKNPLSQDADLRLSVTSPEVHHRSGAMSSRMAQLAVIDILFTAVANKDYQRIEKCLENSLVSCSSHRV